MLPLCLCCEVIIQLMSTTVNLTREQYIDLLIKAGVTDAGQWPPDTEFGAAALSRIRQIEAECVAAHGSFDWEKLEEAVQDEYDSLSSQLDQLRYAEEAEGKLSWEDYLASRKERGL